MGLLQNEPMARMADDDSPAIQRQYELLNILDAKAAALLTFNALSLTAIAVWLGYVPLNFLHLSLDLVFLALLTSCAFLLAIAVTAIHTVGTTLVAVDLCGEACQVFFSDQVFGNLDYGG